MLARERLQADILIVGAGPSGLACALRLTQVFELHNRPRGSLTKELANPFQLDVNPQIYAVGIKELWEVGPGRVAPGNVVHTLGWPLGPKFYGGGWIYGMQENRVSLGPIVGLEYRDSLFDAHAAFQKFKTHPFVRRILEGGTLVRYGAKTLPEGGWYSMPRPLHRWGSHYRRFRQSRELVAAQRHSHRDQKWDAGR